MFSVIVFCLFFNCIALLCTLIFLAQDVSEFEWKDTTQENSANQNSFIIESGEWPRTNAAVCVLGVVLFVEFADLLYLRGLDNY